MSFTTSFARQKIPQLKKYINVSNRRYSSSSSSLLLTTSRPAYSGSTNSFIRKSSSSSPFTNHGSLISRSTTFSSLPFFSHIIRQSFHNKLSKHRSIIRTFKPNSKPRKFLETSSNLEPIASAHLLNFLERPFTSQNPFLLTHGASGIAKHTDQLVSTPNNGKYFSVGCGEDAFFRRHDALGVADGVGGWRNVTPSRNAVPDSALYSRKLMHYAYAELEKYDNNRDEERIYHYNEVYPQDILQTSYEQCIRDCAMEGIIGSSTALIAILREDELRIANLGDCGICIIQRNDIVFRNEEQQHSFNFPYQLGTGSFDTPQDAQTYTIKIQRGDIIILGSDGIFDNLFEDDILEEINRFICPRKGTLRVKPQIISDALAYRAKKASEDLNNSSPFQCRAMQEGLYYVGGKKDDISVLVGVVTDSKEFSN